jgi:hypothetical protein
VAVVALGLEHVLAGALDVLATQGGVVEYLLAVGTCAALKIRYFFVFQHWFPYDNLFPTRLLAPKDCYKIAAPDLISI